MPELIEKKFADTVLEEKLIKVTTVPKIQYEHLEENMNLVKEDFTYVLDKVKIINNSFGKNYLKLELTEQELIKFKTT